MKCILPFCLFVFESAFLMAQTDTGLLRGKVLNSLGTTYLDLANVFVYRITDNNIIGRSVTDSAGFFEIAKLPLYDSIELIISRTGYTDYHQKIFLGDKKISFLDNIRMSIRENTFRFECRFKRRNYL